MLAVLLPGRDYIIFERNSNAGSFFEKFPRHRKLISLNKRFVREGRAADFAFRHDWNSLIDLRENRTQPVILASIYIITGRIEYVTKS